MFWCTFIVALVIASDYALIVSGMFDDNEEKKETEVEIQEREAKIKEKEVKIKEEHVEIKEDEERKDEEDERAQHYGNKQNKRAIFAYLDAVERARYQGSQ